MRFVYLEKVEKLILAATTKADIANINRVTIYNTQIIKNRKNNKKYLFIMAWTALIIVEMAIIPLKINVDIDTQL